MDKISDPILTATTIVEGNEVTLKKYADGALSLSSDAAEHYIYLYPAQCEVLRAFLGASQS